VRGEMQRTLAADAYSLLAVPSRPLAQSHTGARRSYG
jgi:hypothetical protein